MNENKSNSNENAEASGGENPQEGAELSSWDKVKLFFWKMLRLGVREETYKRVRDPEEIFKIPRCQKCLLWINYIVLGISYSIILIQLLHCVPNKISCFLSSTCCFLLVPNPFLSYIALIFVILAWMAHFIIWHKQRVYKLRKEDRSEVIASIREAETAEPRLKNEPIKPDFFEKKKNDIKVEVQRLNKLGDESWVDYEILTLNVMLIDFLKPDDLKARARASLEDLQEYCTNRADRFEEDSYDKWSERIRESCEKIDQIKIDDCNTDKEKFLRCKDDAAEPLRGELRMLMERLSDYDKHWAEGSAVLASIIKCGVTTLPHFLGIGLLPLFYDTLGGSLSFYNMAALGVCGSITAVLISLHQRYGSNEPEVGATKGRTQLWLSILGTSLGLVAGIVFYAMVKGKLLDGNLFPEFPPQNLMVDVPKAIFWGIASGYSFERIFNRMRDISSKGI